MTTPVSTALAVQTDVPSDFGELVRQAEFLAGSNVVKSALRRKPADIVVILLAARAMNLPTFWALTSIDIVEGKPTIAAEMMRARVRAYGHAIRVDATPEKATVKIRLAGDEDWQQASFTMDEAKAAELLTKTNWKRYGEDMLVARATARAVRRICPEVLFGVVYTPEEMGAVTDAEGRAVYNDRGVVLEGEVVDSPRQGENEAQRPAQPRREVTEEDIELMWGGGAVEDLKQAADAWRVYEVAGITDDLWVNPADQSTETLRQVWLDRLARIATYVPEPTDDHRNPTADDLRETWKAANFTGVLKSDWRGVTINKRIEVAREAMAAADLGTVKDAIAVLDRAGLGPEVIATSQPVDDAPGF